MMKTRLRIFGLIVLLSSSISATFSQNTNQKNLIDSILPKFSDELKVFIDLSNPGSQIQDGTAQLKIEGGIPPYQIKWSDQDTPLNNYESNGLTEGKEYMVIVKDSKGAKSISHFSIPAKSADERINAFFIPVVSFMTKILMADIFANLKLYDPIIYTEDGRALLKPNGDPYTMRIPFVVVWLILGALFFTIKMNFINFRRFGHAIQLIKGKYDKPGDSGEVSHFQALATALSATVGLGNIAGVAIAITIGGPGATFWMIIAGLLGMTSKFTEVTLGVKYRNIDEKGVVSGGPMYYLSKALKKRKMGGLGSVLAFIFAILVVLGSFGGGNMFQANQTFAQLSAEIPMLKPYGAYFGICLSILVGIVVIGGIKSIAKVAEKMVPFMAILYVGTALAIIIINIRNTPEAIGMIFNGAFNPDALKGGIVGVLIVGFQRASFSNEAGVGSASIAHSAVKTNEPVSEGIVALLEPFIDTVVICTMTALVIIYTGFYEPSASAGLTGTQLTSKAFESVVPWFPKLLTLTIFLFAFSTMISWSYYGLNGFKFLFGKLIKNEKSIRNIYYIFFLSFIVIGSSSSLGSVLDFSDMAILSMAFPNILGLLILSGEVKTDTKAYFDRLKRNSIKQKTETIHDNQNETSMHLD